MRTAYAKALRAAREAFGIQQVELANQLGFHRALQNEVELAKRRPFHVSRSKAIAEIFGIDPIPLMALSAADRGVDPAMLEGCSAEALETLMAIVLVLPELSSRQLQIIRKLLAKL